MAVILKLSIRIFAFSKQHAVLNISDKSGIQFCNILNSQLRKGFKQNEINVLRIHNESVAESGRIQISDFLISRWENYKYSNHLDKWNFNAFPYYIAVLEIPVEDKAFACKLVHCPSSGSRKYPAGGTTVCVSGKEHFNWVLSDWECFPHWIYLLSEKTSEALRERLETQMGT